MIRMKKNDTVIVTNLDNTTHEAKITSVDKGIANLKYTNGKTGRCAFRHLKRKYKDKERCEKSIQKEQKYKKAYEKIGQMKVSFGKYKEKNMKFSDLLKKDQDYCRVLVKMNYNIPEDFKKYVCYNML
tara:strand:+ start:328 stop:711 length:384 start_codon:yes stop_codon:yes gene_type:complete